MNNSFLLKRFHNKEFRPFLHAEEINKRVKQIAHELNDDYENKNPLFLGILNGAFMFASDLFKHLTIECSITFVKLVSYEGTTSTGKVLTAIGLEENINGRDIVIIEDIVDTGNTMNAFLRSLEGKKPNSIKICTLLQKPEALLHDIKVDYVGFDIPDKFVIGYGLDYDGLGRNIPAIYKIITPEEDLHRFEED